jgi:hypothetical protein
MLPTVDFCGMRLTRMLIGANPFAGFSHQSAERSEGMKRYHTPERILETWDRAWRAGINAFVTNNETAHVQEAVARYLTAGGPMQWLAQLSYRSLGSMEYAIDQAVAKGCRAFYIHGALLDALYEKQDAASLRAWIDHARRTGLPVGAAAHAVEAHYWLHELDLVDFHVVPFFNCGSVHTTGGDRFQLEDVFRATELIRFLPKPCIAYKILGAGRIDAAMGIDYALRHIKPGDVINVGINRQDREDMVEYDVALVEQVLKEMSA